MRKIILKAWLLLTAIILISGCCDTIKRDLEQSKSRVEALQQELSELKNRHIENSGDSILIEGKYLRCFVYLSNNEYNIGILRPIVKASRFPEFLPGLFFLEKDDSFKLDSVVYSKVKISNGFPIGFDISKEVPPDSMIFDLSNNQLVGSIKKPKVWPFEMHNTVVRTHVRNRIHERGHVWQILDDRLNGTSYQLIAIEYKESLKIDTFLVDKKDLLGIDSPRLSTDKTKSSSNDVYIETAKVNSNINGVIRNVIISISTRHTHVEHHDPEIH